ncbi:RNA polymerase sigma-F factor [Clostridium acetireducens DSM 10703]|jgi:RNA polymerase sporulation-specific sigma factor|uniref:RNA polymerase sigma factor n=1 Tax=Clostridium acetireducens DSM 10703 TaxID=1121290 RepID=A0A1E8EX52_9CLOT|nr:RNA polymerase sporulation sigma factor SigF [Clostridium acetireducens]OFI04948.1 RNA polymerase sigma-F factor [Clostridium acetireducens DSM 10703]
MNSQAYKKNNYEDNIRLILEAKKGNKNALDNVVENNLPLVSSITKKFLNRGYDYEDIFQIGCIGLIKAIKNFNTDYKVKFSTYAVPMIIGEIKRFLRDDGFIKVSRSLKSTARKLHYDKEALAKKIKREPTIEELSDYSGIEVEEIVVATESSMGPQYLYDVIHQDDGAPVLLIDKISENTQDDNDIINSIALKEALRDLDLKSRQIIILRYFKDKTQMQVAKMLGISQVQVSRIEKKVLKVMRKKLEDN